MWANSIIQLSVAQQNIKDYETNFESDLSDAEMQITNLKVLIYTSYQEWLEYSRGPIEEIEDTETEINTIFKNLTRARSDLSDAIVNKDLKKTELDYKKRDLVNIEKLWVNNLDAAKEGSASKKSRKNF